MSHLRGALCALLLTAAASAAEAGVFAERTGFGANPGNLRMFLYLPDELREPAPLVVVMHGCRQDAATTLARSGWREAADAGGFALLLPEQRIGPGPIFSPDGRNHLTACFNFAERRDSVRGGGEALSIRQMIDHAGAEIGIDPARVFAAGLSAGGGMTAVMLAAYPEVFAAGGIVAGLPYRCGDRTATAEAACGVTLPFQPHKPAPNRTPGAWGDAVRAANPGFAGPWPRVQIWQGTADGTVDPPNARELVEQWTNVHGIDATADAEEPVGPATRRAFAGADGRPLVESYEIPGFGHATPIDPDAESPCGSEGDPFILDADICAAPIIARFFGLTGTPPTITIEAAAPDGDAAIVVSGAAADDGAAPPAVTVRLDGPVASFEQPAAGAPAWSARVEGRPGGSVHRPVATATDADGLTATARGTPVALGAPPPNQPPTVAIAEALVDGDCVDVSGAASDPDGRVAAIAVTLGARAPLPAELVPDGFAYEECGLPDGTYAVEVVAFDALDAQASAAGPTLEVATTRAETADWLDHMRADRLRVYEAPCSSVGFGACDAAFPTIHAEHGMTPFPLFSSAAGQDWFVDPGNVP